MKKSLIYSASSLAALLVAGCGGSSTGTALGDGAPVAQYGDHVLIPASTADRTPGTMHTTFLINGSKGAGSGIHNMATPSGFSPTQIRTAYGVPASAGAGTIVIVDAYDDPYALADFNAFSAQYGLPKETSTSVTASTNQHFQVVYASGSKPRANSGWSQEESLDIEWAHAMAPNAKIVLVEAASNSNSNLYGADDKAATIAGARECSNSWGGGETSTEASSDSHFNHAGVVYFFSSGDTGGVQDYPAASPNVVAVGGTSLTLNGSGVRTAETAWSGGGCGPSSYEPRPSYQSVVSGIVGTHRGIADIAGVADPNTGVAVHWNGGWYVFGGTSVACPIMAGIANAAGTNRGSAAAQNQSFYNNLGSSNFFDVTSGTAGSFTAKAGYDYNTGVGSPNGIGAF